MKASRIIHQVESWEQFRSLVTALPTTKAKGDAFEALCAAFLRTDPRYVAELQSVWLRHEVPPAKEEEAVLNIATVCEYRRA